MNSSSNPAVDNSSEEVGRELKDSNSESHSLWLTSQFKVKDYVAERLRVTATKH